MMAAVTDAVDTKNATSNTTDNQNNSLSSSPELDFKIEHSNELLDKDIL